MVSKTRICLNCAFYDENGNSGFSPRCLKGLNPSIEHAPVGSHFVREQGAFEPDAMAAFCDSYVWAPPISTKFKSYVRQKVAKDPRFSTVEIPEKFIRFWEKGQSVRLKIERGVNMRYTETGYVSMSTGWTPAFLLVKSTRSRGSSVLLREDDLIVAIRSYPDQRSYRVYRDVS